MGFLEFVGASPTMVALQREIDRAAYKILTRVFNMEDGDDKRFLNFLRKRDCQLPFRSYR